MKELGLGEYLVASYQEQEKRRARLIYSSVEDLQKQAFAGELDVLIVVSEDTLDRIDQQGIAQRVQTLAHEGLIYIGPYRDYLGKHGAGSGVKLQQAIARSNHRYLKAAEGSAERARHDRFFKLTGDAFEPGSFFNTELEGVELAKSAIESGAFSLVRRSSLLLAAKDKVLPHRIFRAGEEDLVLRLVAIEVHEAKTKRPPRPELFDFFISDAGKALFSSFGRTRFGVPVYTGGAPKAGEGAAVPLPKTRPAPTEPQHGMLGGFPEKKEEAPPPTEPPGTIKLKNKTPEAASQPAMKKKPTKATSQPAKKKPAKATSQPAR